jgi:two-component system LytT family response regulator
LLETIFPAVDVVAEAGDGATALVAIRAERPDLVFLDVQMPGLDGLSLLQQLAPAEAPHVVFVTAYDRYAVEAFDLQAVDYLLKPFDGERLRRAVARVADRIQAGERTDRRLSELLEELRRRASARQLERLPVKVEDRVRFVEVATIEWIEAVDKIVRVHAGGESFLVRESLSALTAQLDPERFVRIHRGATVNVARIREVQPWFHGDYVVVLHGGKRLTSGRGFRDNVRRLLHLPGSPARVAPR